MSYEAIILEERDKVALITLNRPEALNALNRQLMDELTDAIRSIEANDAIGCTVITGSEWAFAAGADIKEMQSKSYADVMMEDFITANWEEVTRTRKPVIAAVAGYALGGGCELAMMCDFILAAENAKFGQPEIQLGVIPGAGGSQRLTRFVGKSKSMEMCMTGRMMDAAEAERSGLVSRVLPTEELLDEALAVAAKIADLSRPALYVLKESVNRSYEVPMDEGVRFERRVFHSLFAFDDQTEGMEAFVEKRTPNFTNK